MAIKNVHYPVHTERMSERRQWNRWLIFGWHVYLIIIKEKELNNRICICF